jgi:hypothetical protein
MKLFVFDYLHKSHNHSFIHPLPTLCKLSNWRRLHISHFEIVKALFLNFNFVRTTTLLSLEWSNLPTSCTQQKYYDYILNITIDLCILQCTNRIDGVTSRLCQIWQKTWHKANCKFVGYLSPKNVKCFRFRH